MQSGIAFAVENGEQRVAVCTRPQAMVTVLAAYPFKSPTPFLNRHTVTMPIVIGLWRF